MKKYNYLKKRIISTLLSMIMVLAVFGTAPAALLVGADEPVVVSVSTELLNMDGDQTEDGLFMSYHHWGTIVDRWGINYWETHNDGVLYFSLTDTEGDNLRRSPDPQSVVITVTYSDGEHYDGGWRDNAFRLRYLNWDGTYEDIVESDNVFMERTGEVKTVSFTIPNMILNSRFNDHHDFQILSTFNTWISKVEVAAFTEPPIEHLTSLSAELDANGQQINRGLEMSYPDNASIAVNHNNSGNWYWQINDEIYFKLIANDYLNKSPEPQPVKITVTYLDEGSGLFKPYYFNGGNVFTHPGVQLSGTDTIKTTEFILEDIILNGGRNTHDFSIDGTAALISKIEIEKYTGDEELIRANMTGAIEKNAAIRLFSEHSEFNTIYYTDDGSDPADAANTNRKTFDTNNLPRIVDDGLTVIKAVLADFSGNAFGKVCEFKYFVGPVWAEFNNAHGPVTYDSVGLRAWPGDNPAWVTPDEVGGRQAWRLQGGSASYIYVDIDDDFMYNEAVDVDIIVEYYDWPASFYPGGTVDGWFNMLAPNGDYYDWAKNTSKVELTGSGEWTSYTFSFHGTPFANPSFINGADFRVGLWFGYSGQAPRDLAISKITVVRKQLPPALDITPKSAGNKTGFIFTNGETFDLSVDIQSKTAESFTGDVEFNIYDQNGRVVEAIKNHNNITFDPGEMVTVTPDLSQITQYGAFTLQVDVKSNTQGGYDVQTQTAEFPFSRVYSIDYDAIGSDVKKASLFGAATHLGQTKEQTDNNLKLAKLAGITWIRDECAWEKVETSRGVYNIPENYRYYLEEANRLGINILLCLDYGNILYDGGRAPHTAEGREAFAAYAAYMAQQFPFITHFEVWNEWNGDWGINSPAGENWANQPVIYGKLFIETSDAVKAVNPNAKLIAGGLSGAAVNWLVRMMNAQGNLAIADNDRDRYSPQEIYDAMDGVSFHPYVFPNSPESGRLENTLRDASKRIFTDLGFEPKPIYSTEVGWPAHEAAGGTGVSALTAAVYVPRMYAAAAKNADISGQVIYYELQNGGTNINDREDNFGMIRMFRAPEPVPFAANPKYVSASAYNAIMMGTKFKAGYDYGADIYAYHFERNGNGGNDVLMLWSTSPSPANIGINIGGDSETVDYYDIWGNKQSLRAIGGVVTVSVTGEPVYLAGRFDDDAVKEPVDGQSHIYPDKDEYYAVTGHDSGYTFEIQLERSVELTNAVSAGYYEISMLGGFSVKNGLSFGAGNIDLLEFEIDKSVAAGTYYMIITAKDGEQTLAAFNITVHVVLPYSVSAAPYPVINKGVFDGLWERRAERKNDRNLPVSGNIGILLPHEWSGAEPQNFNINANQTAELKIDLPGKPDSYQIYDLRLEIEMDGDKTSIDKKISFLYAPKAQTPLTIDGNIGDEWSDAMEIILDDAGQWQGEGSWNGISDLSAVMRVKWDDDYLYVSAEVTDDVHFQPDTGEHSWANDIIQLAVDPMRAVQIGSMHNTEIGLGITGSGEPFTYKWHAIHGNVFGEPLRNSQFAGIRDESDKKTYYEAAIAWSEVLPPAMSPGDGLSIGYSFLINDNDDITGAAIRKGYLGYMGGIGSGKNMFEYGDLVLVETETTILPGDVNGDGKVEVADLVALARHIAEFEQLD
ncbi:MAG: hypothetical protein FWH24_05775, partial [Oscillospiraceae bacterium]|nr:hypothetical protein [Oscillospiraceae bacterium]